MSFELFCAALLHFLQPKHALSLRLDQPSDVGRACESVKRFILRMLINFTTHLLFVLPVCHFFPTLQRLLPADTELPSPPVTRDASPLILSPQAGQRVRGQLMHMLSHTRTQMNLRFKWSKPRYNYVSNAIARYQSGWRQCLCMGAPESRDVGFGLSLCLHVRRQTVALHGSGQTRVIVMTVLVVVVVLATAI